MDLESFVKESVLQVVRGMVSAQADATRLNAAVMPPFANGHEAHRSGDIEFDVAVTVASTSGAAGGGGIKVAGVSIGGNGQTEDSRETVSRLRFTIPVDFPTARLRS